MVATWLSIICFIVSCTNYDNDFIVKLIIERSQFSIECADIVIDTGQIVNTIVFDDLRSVKHIVHCEAGSKCN